MLYALLLRLGPRQKSAILFLLDFVLFSVAFALVMAGRDEGPLPPVSAQLALLACMLAVMTARMAIGRLHDFRVEYYQGREMLVMLLVGAAAACAGFVISRLVAPALPYTFFGQVFLVFAVASISARLALREAVVAIYRRSHGATRVLIYGAGRTGQSLAARFMNDQTIQPVAFVDDDPALHGVVILGLRVRPVADLERLVETLDIGRIILAMPSLSDTEAVAVARRLQHLPCEVHAMPSLASILIHPDGGNPTRPIDIPRLLGRAGLEADLPGARDMYAGKTILVTGAGGSIGSEICLQIAASDPCHLVLFDHAEYALYEMHRKLARDFPDVPVTAVLGSVCEPRLVRQVFAARRVDIVLHAAAYKHLPLIEDNIVEGMRNNVLGTLVVAEAAMAHGVENFTLVSTDKAVRPTSWLGYSKRFAEMLVQDMAVRSDAARLCIVRFGNVLGSSGSVIPLFQDQIARGGPITLTHPDVTRYFMTVSEAVRLVLLAGSMARGGDVFVLDMGPPVAIRDLARNLVAAAGHSLRDAGNPDGDIELRITGLRDGEKLTEELLIGSDMLTTLHPKILRAMELHPSPAEMAALLEEIRQAVGSYDIPALHRIVRRATAYLGIAAANADAPTPGPLAVSRLRAGENV